MPLEAFCPDPATWRIGKIASEPDRIVLYLEPLRTTGACPVCGTSSRRIHSRDHRRPWDVPWGRWPVQLVVHARRFCCDNPACPRRMFVEPFPAVWARYARQTERWRRVLWELAPSTRAEMAARVARWMGDVTSPDTLIRRQRAEHFMFPSPRVWGVDECALRRGRTSGTWLVARERRQLVAVLEGRTAEPLTTGLQAHPTVVILVRDRADAYALAGRQATPHALQVADRFPLVRHVGDALQTLLHSRRWQPASAAALPPPASATESPGHTPQPTPRKHAVWEAVQERRGLGQSQRQIAQALGLDRRTVRRYVALEQPPVYPPRRPRPTQLTPYLSYLAERWGQGCHNARRLYQELIRRGYRGSEGMVRIVVRPWRLRQAISPPALTPAQLAWLLLKPAERLTAAERRGLEDYLDANPVLAHGDQLKTRFHALLTAHDPAALEQWLREAESSDLPSFRALARRFRQDDAAIVAALTTPWSMGRCEGPICRVKWLKRLGYGRAKLDFLRQRSLHRRAAPLTGAEQELQVPQQVAA
jgi:transposase